MTAQTTATSALSPAALGARVIAYIIDAIIVGIVGFFVVGAIYTDTSPVAAVVRAVLYAALSYVYFGYSWTTWRASPGQRVMGLMTLNATDGAALTWNQSTMRWAWLVGPSVLNSLFSTTASPGAGLSGLVGLIVLAYYIYLLYTASQDPRKQGFHDKQANTIVTVKTA